MSDDDIDTWIIRRILSVYNVTEAELGLRLGPISRWDRFRRWLRRIGRRLWGRS